MSLDISKLSLPTTEIESLLLPMHAGEIGYLQGVVHQAIKSKPSTQFNPMVVRIKTKIDFLFSVCLAVGGDSEALKKEAAKKVQESYQVLLEQKHAMEAKG